MVPELGEDEVRKGHEYRNGLEYKFTKINYFKGMLHWP